MKHEICSFIFILFILFSCQSTANVSGYSRRDRDYRDLHETVRDTETSVILTTGKLESTANEVEREFSELEQCAKRLKFAVDGITKSESEIIQIIQRIRERKVQPDFKFELPNPEINQTKP
jgi:TolA-binding protein